jgi:membrane protease YdiL (CAAX protease family)
MSIFFKCIFVTISAIIINFLALAVWELSQTFTNILVASLIAIGFTMIIVHFIARKSHSSMFATSQKLTLRQVGLWTTVGLSLPLILVFIYLVIGAGNFVWIGDSPWYLGVAASFSLAILPGFTEEIIYRYYLYGHFKRWLPKYAASIICGFIFGAIHLDQVSNVFDGLMLMIAAMAVTTLFVVIYEVTGSIWAGALVHSTWDMYTLQTGFIFTNNTATNDNTHAVAGFKVTDTNVLISGGTFGVESSIIAIAMYFMSAVIIYFVFKKSIDYR